MPIANLALIYVPQFNEEAGAQRIGLAFGLSWVEVRIVRCILRGRCSRAIGVELGFTEETVRTYIKRAMLKVGINRQSEFFVLHNRTFSPFKLRQFGAPYITTPSSM
jgi:DNA-binding CsgD family transcriptional regulator